MQAIRVERQIGGRTLAIETGTYAKLAHGAVTVQLADTVVFGDESVLQTCDDGSGSGQLWFYDRVTGERYSSFQIPRSQAGEYCSAHLFYPLQGGNKLVSSWYNGGVTVVEPPRPRVGPRRIWSDSKAVLWVSFWPTSPVCRCRARS